MSLSPERASAPDSGSADPAAEAHPITARDVSVDLGGLPVLRGVDLEVQAGESVALLGGNGSGKSTLIRALLGLVPHSRGRIELLGTELRRFRQWRRIGYVPQRSTAVQNGATVAEIVATGRLALRRPFVPRGRADRAAVADALELVGMGGRSGSDVRQLSGGQQQRVMIARALAGRPDLLVLDEPIAGVDLEHQRVLAEVLTTKVLAGTAILVVLHEVGELGRLIDRAVVLREGRVVHDGDPRVVTGVGAAHHDHAGHDHERDPYGLLEGTTDRRPPR